MWIKNQRHGLKQILTNVLIGHLTKGKKIRNGIICEQSKQHSVSAVAVITFCGSETNTSFHYKKVTEKELDAFKSHTACNYR